MNTTHTFSTALNVTIAELAITSLDGTPLSQLQVREPVKLSTTIVFSDQTNGEFAKLLMPASLSLRITFHARPTKPDREIELGSVTLTTVTDVFTYTATLVLEAIPASPLSADKSYQIGAIVRVGNDPFSVPSLIRGFVDGLTLQGNSSGAGSSEAESSKAESSKAESGKAQVQYAELAIAAPSKTSRRKEVQLEKSPKKQEKS